MAWLALPEVQCAYTLVPEHPDLQLDNVARTMRKLPQADFATLLGLRADRGTAGPVCLLEMGLASNIKNVVWRVDRSGGYLLYYNNFSAARMGRTVRCVLIFDKKGELKWR